MWAESDRFSVIRAALAQDIATHGYYTEPNTGIVFYTSSETNGNITGDGEFSSVSWGGYTWGIALPENALTVNSYDYIGLIVSLKKGAVYYNWRNAESMSRLALFPMAQDGPECFTARPQVPVCLTILCLLLGPQEMAIRLPLHFDSPSTYLILQLGIS